MTPYEQHVEKWKGCTRCLLHHYRKRVVMMRGILPCEVLFIGQDPGESEDVLGVPFVGPAGHRQNEIIAAALDPFPRKPTYALGNVVGCIPRGENHEKLEGVPVEAVIRCAPKLQEMIQLAKPKLIVRVGDLAQQSINKNVWKGPAVDLVHPAAILRANATMRGLMTQKAIVTLFNAICGIIPLS